MGRDGRCEAMGKQDVKVRKMAGRYVEELLNGTLLEDILKNAHTDLYHTGNKNKDTREKLERILCANEKERKTAQSTFSGSRKVIQDVLLYNTEIIAKWVYGGKPAKTRITLIDRTESEKPHGIGVRLKDGKLQECYAYESTIVLKKAENQYGFTCVTAYPNILRDSAVPTYRDIRTELHQTKAYQNASKTNQKIWDEAAITGMSENTTLFMTEADLNVIVSESPSL